MSAVATPVGSRDRFALARYYGLLLVVGSLCVGWTVLLSGPLAPHEVMVDVGDATVYRLADAVWYAVLLVATGLAFAAMWGYMIRWGWRLLRRSSGLDNLLGWFALLWC